ncbi:hypothetical protein [Haloglomus halophilum]|jgi:hypothetical protein|uniref:hypothetical protein n=1 Tax=Haloglomus halophilum TaxID=2962672 RepID=UPI0020CA16BB|nr:hypothetical protein [Haloglomus halophilum]
MEVRLESEPGNKLSGYEFDAERAEIVDSADTTATTVGELLQNRSDVIADRDRLRFEIREVTFIDVHSSGYNEEPETETRLVGGKTEFLIRVDSYAGEDVPRFSRVSTSPIPIHWAAERSDARTAPISSLELELLGVLKPDRGEYLPIEEVVADDRPANSGGQAGRQCPDCEADLTDYREISFCPMCGVAMRSGDPDTGPHDG